MVQCRLCSLPVADQCYVDISLNGYHPYLIIAVYNNAFKALSKIDLTVNC